MANRFSTIVSKINKAPHFLQSFLLTKIFNSTVKYAGTTGLKVVSISQQEATLTLRNKKAVQNHIKGIHAIAAAILAESATGIVFGMNVPDNRLPLLKSLKMDYHRRMQGNLTAKASLSQEQIYTIEQDEKGSIIVPVVITDESGQIPIECQMEWAWISKRIN